MCPTGAGGDRIEEQDSLRALPQDDPKQRCPDITKARTLLGWEPKVDLETGLRLSLDYFRKEATPRNFRPVILSGAKRFACERLSGVEGPL